MYEKHEMNVVFFEQYDVFTKVGDNTSSDGDDTHSIPGGGTEFSDI
ncbi:MAG: hypothetical protein LIO80_01840 [Lachnospiraceae bacterium]|nr:hypothetical protein [Lachnospiraceae bacterium]